MLAVNNYDEFIKLVEVIAESHSTIPQPETSETPDIVVLVGPSCSGKSKIATRFLSRNSDFEQLTSYTTKDPTASAENKWYTYVSLEEFRRMCDGDELLTSTMYAGHGYGSKRCDIDSILARGKHVLTTMDICGAMSLKTYYKNVTTIYIKREKKALMASILRKNSSIEDKVNRLASIDYDVQNAALCDYIIDFDVQHFLGGFESIPNHDCNHVETVAFVGVVNVGQVRHFGYAWPTPTGAIIYNDIFPFSYVVRQPDFITVDIFSFKIDERLAGCHFLRLLYLRYHFLYMLSGKNPLA